MGLLNSLRQKPFCNDLHFFLIPVILLILGLKYYFILIFLFIYLIFIFKKTKLMIPILFLLLLFLSIITSLKLIREFNMSDNYQGLITDVDDKSYVVNSGLYKIKCYEKNHKYLPGDIVDVKIELYDNKKSYDSDFDSEEYLYSNNISYSGKVIKSRLIGKGISINSLKYNYLNYLKQNLKEESYNYVLALIFGDNNLNDEIKDSFSILGISHILAISGLHIILIFKIITFCLIKIFHYKGDLIPLFIISLFVIFIGIPPSSFRAILFLIISSLNKKGKIRYTKLDILSISAIIMLLYNPYMLFSLGFILSYLVSFILIFDNDFKKTKSKLINNYIIYFLIFFISLPFTIRITNHISILSLLLSPILSPFIAYILLPISLILSIFPILDIFLKYVYIFITFYVVNLSSYSPLINIKSFNLYMIIIYYFLFIFIIISLEMNKNKIISILMLTLYLLIIISFKYIDPFSYVTFIDVGQGDSALIRLSYNKGNILIDAYNSFDYLKNMGIDELDYLIITHSDSDHVGDYKEICNYFNVKKIIYPKYDEGFDELLSKYPNKVMVDYTKSLKIDDFEIDILGPINSYKEKNSNSIVCKIFIDGTSFLFTGDMTTEEEYDLINKYHNYLDSDILKVGHHGSDTSSCEEFLRLVSPKYSIISVGENNKYNLPKKLVVDRLKKYSKIYMTKDCGNIDFKLINNKVFVSTYR